MASRSYSKRRYRYNYRYRGRSYRPASSYAGKSLYTFAQALAKPASKVAVKVMKKVLGLNTEQHWVDTIETNVATSSTATVMANPLVIPVGDSVNTRTGASVRLTSLVVRGRIAVNSAATTGSLVRIIFFKASDIRGSAMAAANILDATGRFTSHYNMGDTASAQGYSILYDKTFKIEPPGNPGDNVPFRFVYKPLECHLKWDSSDTAGALASLSTNQIRGIIVTSDPGANTPTYWADYRVKFVDN